MVLAPAINPEGFIKYSAILESNVSDPGSLSDMAETPAKQTVSENEKAPVVSGAGIATKENLSLILEKGYDYLCVPRSKPQVAEVSTQGKSVTVLDTDNHPITLSAISTKTDDGSFWLKIKSPRKEFKERSMNGLFVSRFEDALKKIEASLHRKGSVKKYDKVLMRIGRTQESYPSVYRFYQIDIEKYDKEIVTPCTGNTKRTLSLMPTREFFSAHLCGAD